MATAEALEKWESFKETLEEGAEQEEWTVDSAQVADVLLEEEIERAESMLDLEADFDGEGSPAYTEDTFDLAAEFLRLHSRYFWEHCEKYSPVPKITPGPNGSIDLHWKLESRELLVNIPADVHEPAVYYGDNYGVEKIRGSVDPKKISYVIATWLMH